MLLVKGLSGAQPSESAATAHSVLAGDMSAYPAASAAASTPLSALTGSTGSSTPSAAPVPCGVSAPTPSAVHACLPAAGASSPSPLPPASAALSPPAADGCASLAASTTVASSTGRREIPKGSPASGSRTSMRSMAACRLRCMCSNADRFNKKRMCASAWPCAGGTGAGQKSSSRSLRARPTAASSAYGAIWRTSLSTHRAGLGSTSNWRRLGRSACHAGTNSTSVRLSIPMIRHGTSSSGSAAGRSSSASPTRAGGCRSSSPTMLARRMGVPSSFCAGRLRRTGVEKESILA
eukprot:scaffold225_cov111-Isochrysis_galbana.AAC.3